MAAGEETCNGRAQDAEVNAVTEAQHPNARTSENEERTKFRKQDERRDAETEI